MSYNNHILLTHSLEWTADERNRRVEPVAGVLEKLGALDVGDLAVEWLVRSQSRDPDGRVQFSFVKRRVQFWNNCKKQKQNKNSKVHKFFR